VTRAPGITKVTRRVVAVAINITAVKAQYVLGLLRFKLPGSSCRTFLPEGGRFHSSAVHCRVLAACGAGDLERGRWPMGSRRWSLRR